MTFARALLVGLLLLGLVCLVLLSGCAPLVLDIERYDCTLAMRSHIEECQVRR